MSDPQPRAAGRRLIGPLIVCIVGVCALWLLAANPFVKYRLEGQWRSFEPLPRLLLVLKNDGSYDWGTEDPRKGNMQHGRWRVEAGDKLEFVEPGADLHVEFQLFMDRQMNTRLVLDHRTYLRADK